MRNPIDIADVDAVETGRIPVCNPYCDGFWRRWGLARVATAQRMRSVRPGAMIALAAGLSVRAGLR